jgi:carbon dioxide concentrating mechanism protein CcmM
VVRRAIVVPLLSAALAMLVSACGSGAAQEDGKKTGSGPNETMQTSSVAAGSSQKPTSMQGEGTLTYIGQKPKVVHGSSYVGPLTEIFGDVSIGQHDFVASNTIMRAAPGNKVEVGDESNVQDNVTVRAFHRAVTIGDKSSLTHHANVENSDIGDFVFVGYNAEILNSQVGDGSFIYHGSLIDGVKIPEKSFVGPGEVVSDQATADALPKTSEVDLGKYYDGKEQIDTNKEFAKAYIDLYESEGYEAVVEVGPNPKTSWNSRQVEPEIGENVELEDFVRITGDVNIGENSSIGHRSAIRADEGDPISIGPGAIIDDRVTMHATRNSEVKIGKFLVASDDSVLHGPLEMGDDDVVGEGTVVFRARVGDNVQIGEGAVIAGPAGDGPALKIPDDTVIPAGTVVASDKDLETLED